MAVLVSVVKEKGILSFTYDDGRVLNRTIRYADAIVSNPPPGYEEIGNCYIDSSNRLVINHNGSSIIIDPSAVGDHGGLTGLGDDDHVQYVLATGIRAMDELRLTPKASSSGPEGTMFYDEADDHVYVGTE